MMMDQMKYKKKQKEKEREIELERERKEREKEFEGDERNILKLDGVHIDENHQHIIPTDTSNKITQSPFLESSSQTNYTTSSSEFDSPPTHIQSRSSLSSLEGLIQQQQQQQPTSPRPGISRCPSTSSSVSFVPSSPSSYSSSPDNNVLFSNTWDIIQTLIDVVAFPLLSSVAWILESYSSLGPVLTSLSLSGERSKLPPQSVVDPTIIKLENKIRICLFIYRTLIYLSSFLELQTVKDAFFTSLLSLVSFIFYMPLKLVGVEVFFFFFFFYFFF
jgi:hypothetical protein